MKFGRIISRSIVCVSFALCALVFAFNALHARVPARLRRVEYRSERVKGMGGSAVSAAEGNDAIGQNPALLYYSQRRAPKEGYARYLDEDFIYLSKNFSAGRQVAGPLSASLQASGDIATKGADLATVINYLGLADTFSGIIESVPYLRDLFAASGIVFDPNAPRFDDASNFTYEDSRKLNNAYQNIGNANFSFGADLVLFDYISPSMGILLNDSVKMNVSTDSLTGGLIPLMLVGITQDAAAQISFATTAPGAKKFHFGVTLRAFNRIAIDVDDEETFFTLINEADLISAVPKEFQNAFADAMGTGLLNVAMNGIPYSQITPLYIGNGFSSDLGFAWQINRSFRFGAVLQDVISGIRWWDGRGDRIPMNFAMGVTFFSPWEWGTIIRDVRATFELSDLFFRESANFFLKTHLGMHATFFNGFAELYVGLNQGYPTFTAIFPFNFKFIRDTPVLKGLMPERFIRLVPRITIFPLSFIADLLSFPAYVPVIVPLSLADVYRFPTENILMFIAAWLLHPFTEMNLELRMGIYGEEYGALPGARPSYEGFLSLEAYYVY